MERTKKKMKIVIAALICIAATVSGVYAAVTSEFTFVNSFGTGSVDVSIQQLQEQDNELVPIENMSGNVTPYQHVSYIPRVTSERADGYVRLKATLEAPGTEPFVITEENIDSIGEDWVRIGEYFYYTKILGTGQYSDPFTSIIMPNMENDAMGGTLTINVSADIIQSDNFTPDYDSVSPWGDVAIETAKAQDSIQYGVAEKGQIEDATLTYKGSKTLEGSTDNLFEGIDYVMAGDTYKGILTIKNSSTNNVKLFFRTNSDKSDLLEKATLKINFMGDTVYEGNLLSQPLGEYKELTVLGKGKEGKFKFEIGLPDDSQNMYSVLNDQVVWQFKTIEINQKTGKEVPRTGQEVPKKLIVLILVALASGLYAISEFRRQRREER